MKKFTIIALLVSIIFLVACVNLDNFIPIEEHNSGILELENQLAEANSKTETKIIEVADLQKRVDISASELGLRNVEIDKYQNLINNLNSLLKNVFPNGGLSPEATNLPSVHLCRYYSTNCRSNASYWRQIS